MGFLLFLLATILECILVGAGIVLTIVKYLFILKWKTGAKKLNAYFGKLALSKDQYGNVGVSIPMNSFLKERGDTGLIKYHYGDEDDTLSYVTGMNFFKGTGGKFTNWLGKTLNKVDPNHMEKSIEAKIRRDLEGLERLKASGIIEGTISCDKIDDQSYLKYVNNVNNKELL